MSADGLPSRIELGSANTIFSVHHTRTIHAMLALNLLTGFIGKKVEHFPIGYNVKTKSANGGHLGWRSVNIILKFHRPRTIHAMFALNWLTRFRGKKF